MSRVFSIVIVTVISVLLLGSCDKGDMSSKEESRVNSVSFLISKFDVIEDSETERTRTSFTESNSGITYCWSAKDTVGIYPTSGSQVYFAIEGTGGESKADFDGGGWAFKSASKYYSYYPFIGNIYLDRHKIPVSYDGQKQSGLSSKDHLGAYDFMYTPACSSEGGKLSFKYRHLGCIILCRLTLDEGNYTKLAITAPEEVFVKYGYFDLQSDSPSVIGKTYTNQLIIDLENVSITEPSSQVDVYLMSAPVNLKDTEITVSVLNDKRQELQCKKAPSKNYAPQTLYGLLCTSWIEAPQSMGMIIGDWDKGGNIGGDAQ